MTTMDTPRSGQGLGGLYAGVFGPVERVGGPLVDLAFRLIMARIFFQSGWLKLNDFENTVFLFQYEYAVPVLPPEIAAYFATFFELAMPVLLVLGFMTRLAALPLLGMALVIQFVLGASNPAYFQWEHYFWMLSLVYIFVRGAGPISLDHLIWRKSGTV
ncbi:DoxX family protein [Minwuia thermotolerans]|uniref:DoxX family protein n=1 Tax=Minwuia thermotolerans TaxID=2056226 RepID=A0A2M9FZS8_9PROT|nr:DoxX family protein [Minwuia thermotolerans]PJK28955.1 DoxX family protein [Minwuia thermotolerans]